MSLRPMQNGGRGILFPRDDRRRGPEATNGGSKRSLSVHFTDEVPNGDGSSLVRLLADIVTGVLATVAVAGLCTMLMVLQFAVRPFSLTVYRRLAAQLGAASFVDALALLLPDTKVFLTGDSDVPSPVGTSVLVSNHLVDGDWWSMFVLGRCVGLRGSLKVFLRNEYLHVNVENSPTSLNGNGSALGSHAVGSIASSPSAPRNGENGTSHHHFTSGHKSAHQRNDLSLLAKLLHLFLEFPLINGDDSFSSRNEWNQQLRSFAESSGATAPVHFMFFPEGWCQYNGANRRSILAKGNEFAKREGRPQLKHLLLPRARGFNASLECLRHSSPVVYDVTMAYSGYDGSLPRSIKLNVISLWRFLRRDFPREVHIRVKRYSMEEVLQDSTWLDKKWAEKDRYLSHFAKHQSFPVDGRGYCRHTVFSSRHYLMENSVVSLVRLLILPYSVPFLLLLSIPLFWTLLLIYAAQNAYSLFMLVFQRTSRAADSSNTPGSVDETAQTPGSNSAGTPYVPATPFGSPSITSWRDLFSNRDGPPS